MTRAVRGALCLVLCFAPGAVHAQRIKLPVPVKQLEQAVQKDPNDAVARYNLALGHWSEKKYDRTEAELKEAITLEPRFALAHLALSVLPFARRGDLWNESLENRVPVEWRDPLVESDRRYRAAFMINPLLDLRILGAVEPKRSVLWEMIPELSRMYNEWLRGFDDFRDGDYAAAYLRLERLARDLTVAGRKDASRLPDGLLWYRGLAAAHITKYDEAVRDLRELLQRAESEKDASRLTYLPLEANHYRYVLAEVLRFAGRLDEAAPLYREVLTLDAGVYLAHVALAQIHEQRGDVTAALAERQLAVAGNPEDFTSEVELAVTLTKLGRNRDAEEALMRVVSGQPRHARAWYFLSILQEADGRTSEARASLQRFLDTVPSRFEREIAEAKRKLTDMET